MVPSALPDRGLMSRINSRRLVAIAAAAFVLRLGVAWITETKPLFPDYYYTDARNTNLAALKLIHPENTEYTDYLNGTLSQILQAHSQALLYRLFGVHPFVMKVADCALGALGIAALVLALETAVGTGPALFAGLLCAVWPSQIFYTSQNFKEAPTIFFAYTALAALLPLFKRDVDWPRTRGVVGGAALLCLGCYRTYLLTVFGGALLAAYAIVWIREKKLTAPLKIGLIATLTAAALVWPVAVGVHKILVKDNGIPMIQTYPQFIPLTYDGHSRGTAYKPFSPSGLTRFRRIRQAADRDWADFHYHREIGSQIFPDAEFKSWLDVLLFIPKGAFYALFMPLPGAYPTDGKIGRILASGENVLLLTLAILALVGIARTRWRPEHWVLFLILASMTVGTALLEFDLGSAGRHKLLFLALLFPFALQPEKTVDQNI